MTDSPDHGGFAFDGNDEPLFADDLDDYDDDGNLSTLPPPLTSLSELREAQERGSGRSHSNDYGDVNGGTMIPAFDMGRGADPSGDGTNDQAPPLKKRKPILTLKIDRIFSENTGLPYIQREFPKQKFKGKGHELSDLKHLMRQYEHWANMLYPKMTFSDVTDRIEALARKREFKTQLTRMRRSISDGRVAGGADTAPLSDSEDDEIANNVAELSSTLSPAIPQTLNVQVAVQSPQQTSPPFRQPLSPSAPYSSSCSPRHTAQSISSPRLHTPSGSYSTSTDTMLDCDNSIERSTDSD